MYKVFYNPDTMKIMGYSDGATTFDLPFVYSDVAPRLMWNYEIVGDQCVAIKNQFTQEEWDIIQELGHL